MDRAPDGTRKIVEVAEVIDAGSLHGAVDVVLGAGIERPCGDRAVVLHADQDHAAVGVGECDSRALHLLHRRATLELLEQHGQRGGASYRLSGTLRPPAGLQLSPEELAEVVAQLADGGPISNSDVRAATGLDRAEALAVLDRLVRQGRLVRTGQRRGAKYHRP